MRREKLFTCAVLLAIVAVAAWLRLWNLTQGLPGVLHPDEGPVLDSVKRVLLSGSLHPRFFIYPALQIYLTAAAAAFAHPLLSWASHVPAWPQYCTSELHLATVGRALVAAFGVATVVLVYVIGRRLVSGTAGLAAAAFLAVCPYHALDTRYTNVDVAMTFWGLLALHCALVHARRPRPWVLWTGVAAVGAAAATKYLGVMFVLPLWVAVFCQPPGPKGRGLLKRTALCAGLLAGVALAFLALAPYTVLDYPSFRAAMDHETRYGYQAQLGWDLSPRGWVYHRYVYQLAASLPFCLGFGIHALALWGLAALWRRRGPGRWVFMAGVVPYFLLVGSLEHVFPRYLVPLLPGLCVAAGAAVAAGMDSGRRWRRGLVWALAGLGLAQGIGMASTMSAGMDPHIGYQAEAWITDNVPAGSTVAASYLQHMIPFRDQRYRLVRLEPTHAWLARHRPHCLVVDGWTLMSLARAGETHRDPLRFYRSLDRSDSPYRHAATFDAHYLTEGLYAELDPQFRNHFESACMKIYLRRSRLER